MNHPSPSAVEWVDEVLADAIYKKASDVHIEPAKQQLVTRLRIDGLLSKHRCVPANQTQAIVARIKIMAGLDIGQQRLPQDGRIRFQAPGASGPDEFRVSTCPTLFGEKVVLRHLDTLETLPSIDQLGMTEAQQSQLIQAIENPWGLILVTGPTGSGKTVTLYSSLSRLNQAHRNISTIEDPIEMTLPGINQVQCHEGIGLGFASTLRAFLRQDPDVLMIGEIRDQLTAKMTIEAAQTGHLVFSTLHTNTALATLTRLKHLGISPIDIAQALRLIVAQALMRKLHTCRRIDESPRAIALAKQHKVPALYCAGQCSACRSGYLGRIGVFETLSVTPKIASHLVAQSSNHLLADHLRAIHHVDLYQAALGHVLAGNSSLAEMHRITSDMNPSGLGPDS